MLGRCFINGENKNTKTALPSTVFFFSKNNAEAMI